MTDYAICPTCGAALTSGVCDSCEASSLAPPGASTGPHYNGFWQRFLIASIPAALLALFVESTLYGYALYLGIYLTYCAWGAATATIYTTDDRLTSIQSHGRATANS